MPDEVPCLPAPLVTSFWQAGYAWSQRAGAAALAFHNVVWRYIFALGSEHVLPAALGRTGSNNIPKAASLLPERDRAGP